MRLTKRQLKRIIREEYTRLRHQGLINEELEFDMDSVRADYEGSSAPDRGEYSDAELDMIADYDLEPDEDISDGEMNMYADYGMKVPVNRMQKKGGSRRDSDFATNESHLRRRLRRAINEAMMSADDPDYNAVGDVIMAVMRAAMFGHIRGPNAIHEMIVEEAEHAGVSHHIDYIGEKVFERIQQMGL